MARKRKADKERKKKKVAVTLIERMHAGKVTEPYRVLDKLVGKHHKHLVEAEARIGLAWDEGPAKEDADGFTKFGRVRRESDLDRARLPFDFTLIIRREIWQSFDATRKEAEIDRLLCRCMVSRDKNGEILVDEKDRTVFRLRRPVEVFPENVARYGFHQEPKLADMLARFNDSQRPLLKEPAQRFSEPAHKPKAETNGKAKGGKKAAEKAAPATNGAPAEEAADNAETADAELIPIGQAARDVSIDDLEKLPDYINKALTAASLWTLGDLADYEERGQKIKDVPGITDRGAELLKEALVDYRIGHPEKFETAEAA